MDNITVATSNNASVIEIPKKTTAVDPLNRPHQSDVIQKQGAEFRLRARESKTFSAPSSK